MLATVPLSVFKHVRYVLQSALAILTNTNRVWQKRKLCGILHCDNLVFGRKFVRLSRTYQVTDVRYVWRSLYL